MRKDLPQIAQMGADQTKTFETQRNGGSGGATRRKSERTRLTADGKTYHGGTEKTGKQKLTTDQH
jgi:hypothetical protein